MKWCSLKFCCSVTYCHFSSYSWIIFSICLLYYLNSPWFINHLNYVYAIIYTVFLLYVFIKDRDNSCYIITSTLSFSWLTFLFIIHEGPHHSFLALITSMLRALFLYVICLSSGGDQHGRNHHHGTCWPLTSASTVISYTPYRCGWNGEETDLDYLCRKCLMFIAVDDENLQWYYASECMYVHIEREMCFWGLL